MRLLVVALVVVIIGLWVHRVRVLPHVGPSLVVLRAVVLDIVDDTPQLSIVELLELVMRRILRPRVGIGVRALFGSLRVELQSHLLLVLHLLSLL